jgi:uncharacterized protein (DUF885 family)
VIRRVPRSATAAAMSLAFVLGFVTNPRTAVQTVTVDDFFDRFTAEWIRGNPNQAAGTRYFTGDEQRQFERQLTPLTAEWRAGRVALASRGLKQLATFDRAAMTDVQRLSADAMQWQLEALVRADRFADYYFPFEQFGGANVGLVSILTVTHPIVTEADAENYVARLGEVAPRLREAIADARRLIAAQMMPPRFILRATVAQMQQFVAVPAADNALITSFVERMAAAKAIPEDRRAPLRAQAEAVVSSQVYPAWKEALALLESLLPRATDEAGLWRFKGGAEAYADALRRFTTTDLSAEQIHEIGLREVARLEREMDAIFRKLGRTSGTITARIEQLRKDLAYPITEDGRALIMADIDRFIRDAETRAATQFDRRPRSPVVAQPFPRFREANAAASYSQPALDGSRPGTFQIPLRPDRMTKFGLRTLVYHETVPGHHFQIALEMESEAVPRFRRIRAFGSISALNEGWGLYAERLAAESGWYDGDLEGLLGQLDGSLFRARRLVVDTGLHAKRWTRQQAIDYGISPSEVERYVVNPGQACAYMIGQLKIIELRDKARAALGSRFSEREFHNVVLGTGTVPLEILERQVAAYIKP